MEDGQTEGGYQYAELSSIGGFIKYQLKWGSVGGRLISELSRCVERAR